ncbi:MAG: hypothetical protein M3116_04585 [Actinomycetota bacterium]|nr:hypothetical protein [Actinomycetota bacterium]
MDLMTGAVVLLVLLALLAAAEISTAVSRRRGSDARHVEAGVSRHARRRS